MIHEYPEYYEKFVCIGGSCPDSCCIGWELDIDEETYDYYKNVSGEFGDRLRANMSADGENTFVLAKHDRCPFLNDENLCDIFINLGEESLCKVCTEYPRYNEVVEEYMQSDISLSCMEAGRIIFSETEKMNYLLSGGRRRRGLSPELESVLVIRDKIIAYLNECCDKDIDVRIAVAGMLDISERLHGLYGDGEHKKIKKFKYDTCIKNQESDCADFVSYWNEICDILKELEVIDESWEQVLKKADNYMDDKSRIKEFTNSVINEFNEQYYKILIYFIFRYMIRAYDDSNILSKTRFAIFSLMAIMALDYARWKENDESYLMDDRIDVAHIYSKEIEHSAENVDYILEEMLFFDFDA